MTTTPAPTTGEVLVLTDDIGALRLGVALGARRPPGSDRLYMRPSQARRFHRLLAAGFTAYYSGGAWKPQRAGVRYSWATARSILKREGL